MDNSNWTFLQTFTPEFQAMRSDLDSKVAAAKALPSLSPDTLNELSVLLAKATKLLLMQLARYPHMTRSSTRSNLEKSIETLRAANVAKPKFAFKRKPKPPASASPPASTPKASPARTATSTPLSTSTNLVLSTHTHKYLTRSDLTDHPQQTDLAISDLDFCIIDLLPSSTTTNDGSSGNMIISALHARNLTNCVLLLPVIEGSALLHDLSQCVIVLGSHQFRMHSSKNIDVLLSISSNPIIEDCHSIRFAQYPEIFLASPEGNKESTPFSVQDFSHIRPTPSPHYSWMTSESHSNLIQQLVSFRAKADIMGINDALPQ
ncbi:hypothetical protein M413DRAFT_449346 [Hebeloma cylindrosporum]|uniref:C-CAP/cofactor C-like domain-containing protein n=1 Tax=Hebeloma cylindrosporum TaxID=76867 RepID=A0A0C3BVP8_HEBCY|nr:hypothetical protein M413DRAFT_449346 [Hebeloma cylindrosporum h7]